LLDPLRLHETFTAASAPGIAGMAVGYQHVRGRIRSIPISGLESWGWSAGDLISTVDDLATWSVALADGRVVTSRDYALMATSQKVTQGDSGYGFGLFVDSKYGQPRVGHTGGGFGFTSADEYFPKQRVRVIALTNDGEEGDPEAGETITNIVFGDLHPALVARELTPNAGEDHHVTSTVRRVFQSLQTTNTTYSLFAPHLQAKLRAGLSLRLAPALAPYGTPTRLIFKSQRRDANGTWYTYEIAFSPGVLLSFGVHLDAQGKASGLSFG